MIRAYKYRLSPNRLQEEALLRHLDLTRELYNAGLQERREAYRKGCSITHRMQEGALPAVKEARPEFESDIYSHVLQDVIKRLQKAFDGFFRRVKAGEKAGYPRFKGKGWWDSFAYKECSTRTDDGWKWTTCGRPDEEGKRINLPKIGKVKIKMHRPLEGRPKTLTIKREGTEWYAVYTCEVEKPSLTPPSGEIGLDLGTRYLYTTSEGNHEVNPRWQDRAQKKIVHHQRCLSRKKRGSKRRQEVKRCLSKAHLKVKRQRLDHAHKTSNHLVQNFGKIIIEDLKPSKMVHGFSSLNRSIHDAGWSSLISILSLKAESAGVEVVQVDPAYTSQRCFACGYVEKGNRKDEDFKCLSCGHRDHADVNAAKNILEKGTDLSGYEARTHRGWMSPAGPEEANPRNSEGDVSALPLSELDVLRCPTL